jgi:multidrug resistance efflux pump
MNNDIPEVSPSVRPMYDYFRNEKVPYGVRMRTIKQNIAACDEVCRLARESGSAADVHHQASLYTKLKQDYLKLKRELEATHDLYADIVALKDDLDDANTELQCATTDEEREEVIRWKSVVLDVIAEKKKLIRKLQNETTPDGSTETVDDKPTNHLDAISEEW